MPGDRRTHPHLLDAIAAHATSTSAHFAPSAANCPRCSALSPARRARTLDNHTPSRTDVPSGNSSDQDRPTTTVPSRSAYWASATRPRSNAPARPPRPRLHRYRPGGRLLRRPDTEPDQALALPPGQRLPPLPLGGQPRAYVQPVHHRPGLHVPEHAPRGHKALQSRAVPLLRVVPQRS